MNPRSEQSTSLWQATAPLSASMSLEEDLSTDVCIVGAGIAGITTAYLLTQAGHDVVVLDSRQVGAGQTQRTSAHLTNAHDNYYSEVEKIHGLDGIRVAAESHTTAIDTIESIIEKEGMECDFQRVPGYLFCDPSQDAKILQTELDAATRAGLKGLEIVGRAPLPDFDTGPCLRYPQQARFHPLKYLAGLRDRIQQSGGRIYGDALVKKIEGGAQATIETATGRKVTAKSVVVATNTPINDMYAMHTKMAPYLTYVIGAKIPVGTVTPGLYWDTLEAYHYVRLQPLDDESEILLVGGEDHKAGKVIDQTERHQRLETWARERFPRMGEVDYRWSGMVMETTDGGAFIGRNPGDKPNVFIATGDSGMGLTHGTMAGLILTELLQGRDNPWAKFYDPSRKPVSGMAWRNFVSENANVGKEYVQDWLTGGDSPPVEELNHDQGTVVRRGLSKVAVYRDAKGKVHECSAVCPHLGCIVHWNDFEKVWDCPCHGSRFSALGDVINGPAISNLSPRDDSAAASAK